MTLCVEEIDIRDAFFNRIYDIASKDKDVVFITADADAFGLKRYRDDFPTRFINIGVAEQNMVAVSAGLALSGKCVFIYAIIPFVTMRCYEHIKVNICSMNLPVTIVGAGAGLSFGNDGPTHHAVHDIAVMRVLPEMTILNPGDACSASKCAQFAYESRGPCYVRLDKGVFPVLYDDEDSIDSGLKVVRDLSSVNIISTGFMTHKAMEVASELENRSIKVGVIDLLRLKPVNETLLLSLLDKSEWLITLEENSIVGGIGTILSEILCGNGNKIRLKRIALEDKQHFAYGSRQWLHSHYGLSIDAVTNTILEEIAC